MSDVKRPFSPEADGGPAPVEPTKKPRAKKAKVADGEDKPKPKPRAKKVKTEDDEEGDGEDKKKKKAGAWTGDMLAQLLEFVIVEGSKNGDLAAIAEQLGVSKSQVQDQLKANRSNMRSFAIKAVRER